MHYPSGEDLTFTSGPNPTEIFNSCEHQHGASLSALPLHHLSPSLSFIFSPSVPSLLPADNESLPRSKLATLLCSLPHSAPHRCANTGHNVKAGHPRSYQHMPHRQEMAAQHGANDRQFTDINESDLSFIYSDRPVSEHQHQHMALTLSAFNVHSYCHSTPSTPCPRIQRL